MDKKTIIAWIIFIIFVVAVVWYYLTMMPTRQPVEVTPEPEQAQQQVTQESIVGIWAVDNGSVYTTREFRADGTIEERFDGNRDGMIDNSVSGTWQIMTAADLAAVTLPAMNVSGTVVRVEYPEEAFYMLVNVSEDNTKIDFTYYGQEGTYTYTRL